MNPQKWQKVEELLNAALEIEPTRRGEFLQTIGANNLRREVESLLDCDAKTNGFLASPAVSLSFDFFGADEKANARLDQTFGRYRIVGDLGRGGMGAVFLAERSDGVFEQRVALKIVRQTILDAEIERRFRQERQILASLNHPNIARLLDGGISDSGEPFLVMEYVEGRRIDDFCRAENLPTRERLKLFLAVCGAVSFAHQNLIVHRDLKPSNILVTKDGTVKLLDFGIAKLLGAEQPGEPETQTNLRAFTPEYASPEQITGKPITTTSDIYSLGIILSEMVGCPLSVARRPLPVVSRPSLSKDAAPPNEQLTTDDGQRTNRELKNIVRMAMREEPERRYASVSQFAEDVQRFLGGLPVRAQKDSFTYRAGKFAKRNRLPVSAIALVVLSLCAGIAVAAWQASLAREKANSAEENLRLATVASEKQKKITGFMERVLSYASPAWYAEGGRFNGQARVIDVLEELSGKIEIEFPDDLDIQAELHHKCAEIFLANQMFDRAERHARRALELRRRVFGERHPEFAKDLYYLGEVLGVYRNNVEKEPLLREAAAIFREIAPDNANLPYLLEGLGDTQMWLHNDFEEAENLFTESLALHRRRSGEIHFNTARLYFHLSSAAAGRGETERAEELFREGEWRTAQLPNAGQRLATLGFRGKLEFFKGNLTAAEAAFKQYIDEGNLTGANDGNERNARQMLLTIYIRENDWAKAVKVQRAQIADMKNRMPETDFVLGAEFARLSVYLLRTGETVEAERHFSKAYQIFQNDQPNAKKSDEFQLDLGECLMLLNRRDEALPLLEEMREFYKTNYPPNFHLQVRSEELVEQARSQ